MRIQATSPQNRTVYGERYFVGYSTREAVKRYRDHFGLKGKRGLIFRISR